MVKIQMNCIPYEIKVEILCNIENQDTLNNVKNISKEWNTIYKQNRSKILANILYNKYGKNVLGKVEIMKNIDIKTLKYLVEKGVNIHVDNDLPLTCSARNGSL